MLNILLKLNEIFRDNFNFFTNLINKIGNRQLYF